MVLRRLAGEKETVLVILGGGVGGFCGCEGAGVVEEVGAKKREMTCCFCFPMAVHRWRNRRLRRFRPMVLQYWRFSLFL